MKGEDPTSKPPLSKKIATSIRVATSFPFLAIIWLYQKAISPFLPAACRFTPTCSAYGLTAIRMHGPLRGGALTLWRIARCNPFGGTGYDPVPGTSVRNQELGPQPDEETQEPACDAPIPKKEKA
jgi:putative membrane protein insertion efficiency factor